MEKQLTKGNVKLQMVQSRSSERSRFVHSPSIPVEDVAVLFRCGSCHEAPIRPPVYSCRTGHLTCSGCYRRVDTDCHKCKDPLLSRNLVLEEVVRGLTIETCAALSEHSAPLRESRSELSLQLTLQDPSHLEKLERARVEAERQEAGDSARSLGSICEHQSYRPVKCPYPCNRSITCSGLFPHFEFQHPRILLTTLALEQDFPVTIDCAEALKVEYRCFAFFVLRLDDVDAGDPQFNWTSADLLKMTRSSQEMLRNACFISTLSVGRLANPLAQGEDSWFLVVWSTCLYEVPAVTYTLRATSQESSHAISFTGPLTTLQRSQQPEDVYARGECLLIPPAIQKELRFGKKNNLINVTITYHSDLPFPFKPPDSLFSPLTDQSLLEM